MADSRDSLLRTEWRLTNIATSEEYLFNSDTEILNNPFCPLTSNTEYKLEARHIGRLYGASDWSIPIEFNTSSLNSIAPGQPDCTSSSWGKVDVGQGDCDSSIWLSQEYIAKPIALCVYIQETPEAEQSRPVIDEMILYEKKTPSINACTKMHADSEQ